MFKTKPNLGMVGALAFVAFTTETGANETRPIQIAKAKYEEMTVRAQNLSYLKPEIAHISVGLSNTVLVHKYDKKTDSWKYIGSKVSKSEKN